MVVEQAVDFWQNCRCAWTTKRTVNEVVLDIDQEQRSVLMQLAGELATLSSVECTKIGWHALTGTAPTTAASVAASVSKE